jgi:signal transduction histidine kinase
MSDVSCRAFSYFQQAAARGQIDLDAVMEGSALSREVLARPTQRVPWDDWAALCDRYVELVGRETAESSAADLLMESDLGGPLRGLAAALTSPTSLYHLAARVVGPMLYRNLAYEFSPLDDGRVAFSVHIPEPYRESEGWMLMARGALSAVPRFLGAADAVVVGSLGPRGGRLELMLPPSLTWWSRVKRWFRLWRGAQAVTDELLLQQRALLESERSLQDTEQINRALVESFPDLMIILDGDLQVVEIHAAREGVDARVLAGARGRPFFDILRERGVMSETEAEAERVRVSSVLRDGRPEQFEYRMGRGPAAPVMDIRIVPIGSGRLLIVVRDVSDRAALERRLAVSERMAWMGQLAAGVAHEVNNPLTYVTANVEMLLEDVRSGQLDAGQLETLLQECLEGAERVRDVVRDLSQFSRVSEAAMEPLQVADVIRSAVSMAAHSTRHRTELTTDVPDALPKVSGDTTRLSQVVVNLLINAAHATEDQDDGRVTLSARAEDTASGSGSEVSIYVDDNGPGIPDDALERVFEPFFTTKKAGQGTGLGLSISQRVILEMGGTLTAENRDEGGARFAIRLPALTSVPAAPVQSPKAVSLSGLRILVVDDEPAVARAAARVLSDAEVEVVHLGAEARARLMDEPSAYDVVLCDLMMPDVTGMAVYEAVPAASERIVFMSGGAVTEPARAFLAQDHVRKVHKPFTTDQLRRAVLEVARREVAGS